jgi:hypothetical protein
VSYDAGPEALIDDSAVSLAMSPNQQNELKISALKGMITGM